MTLCLARQRASARFSALHSQNETEIIQFSTAASRAVRSARSDDARSDPDSKRRRRELEVGVPALRGVLVAVGVVVRVVVKRNRPFFAVRTSACTPRAPRSLDETSRSREYSSITRRRT